MDQSIAAERAIQGACMLLAPLLLAASTVGWSGASAGMTGGVLIVYSFACWIGVFLAFAARLGPRWPRLGPAVAAAGVLGCVAGSNFGMEGIVEGALGIADLSEALVTAPVPGAAGAVVMGLFLPGLLFPAALLLSAALLLHARAVPRWVGTMLVLGAILFPLGRIPRIHAVALAADALLLAPLLALAWEHLRPARAPAPVPRAAAG